MEMETYCRRCWCDTIDEVITSAEAFETSTLNKRPKGRSESEDSSSSEDERKPKKKSHANVECRTYPVNAVEWVPAWEAGGYYTEAPEEAAYAVQEGPPTTPIQPAHITRFVPKKVATTVPQQRLAPAAAAGPPPPNACFNCGDVGHFAPNCPQPRKPRGYIPLCANCRQQGHTTVECNQPRVARQQVRFVTPPPKEDVQVNQVEQCSKEQDDENRWPDEETMVGRVKIRRATRKKESTAEKAKRDKKGAKKKDSKETESREPKKGAPPKTSESLVKESSAKKDKSVKELRTLSQDYSQSDGPTLKILQKAYAPDIKDEVEELLREELEKTPPRKTKEKESVTAEAPARAERAS
ncbi:hypothetical protein AXG93_3472s1070 [Marchantia polymorpha subsp. ruderalis]|uniref:CCHC-type domain-containing protein n=1 Tax=Marchantia polymorpha subsp. ruderalis TaxID=1480154 RepID=A0A176WQ89_MARPO|nr:hypothetical protein AXG93_3472s1070 [Marchantia polymorpha subsp. ruderalis]